MTLMEHPKFIASSDWSKIPRRKSERFDKIEIVGPFHPSKTKQLPETSEVEDWGNLGSVIHHVPLPRFYYKQMSNKGFSEIHYVVDVCEK